MVLAPSAVRRMSESFQGRSIPKKCFRKIRIRKRTDQRPLPTTEDRLVQGKMQPGHLENADRVS